MPKGNRRSFQPDPRQERLKILTQAAKRYMIEGHDWDQTKVFVNTFCIEKWGLGYHTIKDYERQVDVRLGNDPEVRKVLEN